MDTASERPTVEPSKYYSALWDEDQQVYWIMHPNGTAMGMLLDDTCFAHKVLAAFEAEAKLAQLKRDLACIKLNAESTLKRARKHLP